MDRQICAVCCGTKRLVEIRCPPDCGYLTASRAHPPAVVQRQQQRDLAILLPTLGGLTERQSRLLFLLGGLVARSVPRELQPINDDDIAEAAASLASTLETADRGIIYEHRAESQVARQLVNEMRDGLTEIERERQKATGVDIDQGSPVPGQLAGSGLARDAAVALRRIEQGARESSDREGDTGLRTAYRDLLGRLLNASAGDAEGASARPGGLILP